MITSFAEALKELARRSGDDAAFRIAREQRPTSDYLLTRFLPEMLKPTYSVESGRMVIHATMAGQAGMDSKFPEGGVITGSQFLESTAKIANQVTMTEKAQRELQSMLNISAGDVNMVDEALNFLEKLVIQPHWDTMEYLKGQIFTTGKIDWTFNGLSVNVDYSVPSANKQTTRSGTEAYGGADSKWWVDIRWIQKTLDHNLQAIICHPDTFELALDNSANNIRVLEKEQTKYGNRYRITRVINDQGVASDDTRDTVTIETYGAEGELIDKSDPKSTIKKPFLTAGKLIGIGENQTRGYIPGEGATEDPDREKALGYTHIAPTVEGGGQMGRWARLRVPDDMPMQLQGQGVTNGLPVVEVPEKIAIATTDMP